MRFEEPRPRGIRNYKLKRSIFILCLVFGTTVCLVYTRPPTSIGSSDEVYEIKSEREPIKEQDEKRKSSLISTVTDRADFQFFNFKSGNINSSRLNNTLVNLHNVFSHPNTSPPNLTEHYKRKSVPPNKNADLPNLIPPNMIAIPPNMNAMAPLPNRNLSNLIDMPATLNTVPHHQNGKQSILNAPPNMIAVPLNLNAMPSNMGYVIPTLKNMAPNEFAGTPHLHSNSSLLSWTPMFPQPIESVQKPNGQLLNRLQFTLSAFQKNLPPNKTDISKKQFGNFVKKYEDWSSKSTVWKTNSQIPTSMNITTVTGINGSLKNSSISLWTWECISSRCERRSWPEHSIQMSLATCNMICINQPLWPSPRGKKHFKRTIIPISEIISLHIHNETSEKIYEYLEQAFDLLNQEILNLIKPTQLKNTKRRRELRVHVTVDGSTDPRLKLNTRENYKLTLNTTKTKVVVDIRAESFCGARHGFATLSQLIWFEPFLGSLVTFEGASIEDSPKFRYRGLLLDTARQFFPVRDILRTLDAMAISKLNTFHWHATDSQSFPLKLKSAPFLSKFGAYGPEQIYTTKDIKTIVQHARLRGIRVVIEVDVPAHVGYAWSWGQNMTYGDLTYCVNQEPWREVCGEPPCGQLNPSNEHVYDLLHDIYAEIIELTGVDDVFHLGGDEVNLECWNRNVKFKNHKNAMDVWYDFMQRAKYALMTANGGKLPHLTIIWSSKLTSEKYLKQLLYNEYTIQIWEDAVYIDSTTVSGMGIRIINSQVSNWYLDCGFGSWVDDSLGSCGKYRTWLNVYNHITWMNYNNWNVEGGTACMWTELVGPSGLDARVWPRGAALAERLWEDPSHAATDDEYIRLDMHRTRLVERGIKAEPIWSRWCSDNPYKCLVNNDIDKDLYI